MHHCGPVRAASRFHSSGQASLPAVVEGLLVEVVRDGFVLYCCGTRAASHALIASYEFDHYIDLVTIRDFDRITTPRVPKWTTTSYR